MTSVLPSGNPLWLRNPGITQYGGDVNKKDYGGIGVVNAQTDIGAAQFSRLTADLAAVARVVPLMRLEFTPNSGTIKSTVNWCAPAWATPRSYPIGDSPPTAAYPTITGTGTSRTITVPSNAADDYGVSAVIVPRIVLAVGGVWDGTISANAFTLTGLTDGTRVCVTVW